MAVGNAVPKLGHDSCISIMEESSFNVYVTGTSNFLEFSSESFGQEREAVKLESVNCSRAMTKRFVGNETVSGSLEFDLDPAATAIAYIFKQAFGGIVGIPTTFVIDKKGIVRYAYTGSPGDKLTFQRHVEELLAE